MFVILKIIFILLNSYVYHKLEQLVTNDYILIYFHGATPKHRTPDLKFLRKCYQMINFRYRIVYFILPLIDFLLDYEKIFVQFMLFIQQDGFVLLSLYLDHSLGKHMFRILLIISLFF